MKIAIVTGAERGIGRSIALTLAQNGFTVVAASVSAGDAEHVCAFMDELRAISPESVYIKTDISSDADRKNLVESVVSKFGKIDVLVNNAGVAPTVRNDILQMSEESMDRLLNINLKGTFFLTQRVANAMIDGGFGSAIINITSMSVYTSSTSRGEYCISKAGLAMVTTLFADRLASTNIRVYEVRPGIIETPMTAGVKGKYDALIEGGLLPISRMGQPEDVARAVLMLASGYLAYSTGEVINVDGGFHIQRL
ncbi:MAG: 3-ketoacyl-ACP reductase [Clostridia bacterium]|nr:3-ketoacyl-ACP reductase [Clostridia bacterium]